MPKAIRRRALGLTVYSQYLHHQQVRSTATVAATMPCILAVMGSMVESRADSKAAGGEGRVDQLAIQGAEEVERPPGLSAQGEPGQWDKII